MLLRLSRLPPPSGGMAGDGSRDKIHSVLHEAVGANTPEAENVVSSKSQRQKSRSSSRARPNVVSGGNGGAEKQSIALP